MGRKIEHLTEEDESVDVMPKRDSKGVRINGYKRWNVGKHFEQADPEMIGQIMFGMKDSLEDVKKRGRPRKYDTVEELIEAVQQYYQYIVDANADGTPLIPDIEGLCAFIQISRSQLFRWEHERGEDFRNTIALIKNQIAAAKKQLALQGSIPPIVFATDFNNNHGYVQKQDVNIIAPVSALGESVDTDRLAVEYAETVPMIDMKEEGD